MSAVVKIKWPLKFCVECTAEIDNHIGKALAYIVAHGPEDWYVDSVENKHFGYLAGDQVDSDLHYEIEAEVKDYFAKMVGES